MTKISRCEFYQLLPQPAPPECPSARLSDGDLPDETEEENPPELQEAEELNFAITN